jgi:hypothetical protein
MVYWRNPFKHVLRVWICYSTSNNLVEKHVLSSSIGRQADTPGSTLFTSELWSKMLPHTRVGQTMGVALTSGKYSRENV